MTHLFHVRKAQIEDTVSLAELNSEFNAVRIPADRIAACLHSPRNSELVVVAVAADQVVGFACVQIITSMCYRTPWAELTEVYIREAYRRQGIGRALVHEGERLARQQRANEMVVRTGQENTAGQALYMALGYVKRPQLTLQKNLSEPIDTPA